MSKVFPVVAVAVCFGLSAALASAAGNTLSGEQIQKLLAGRSATFTKIYGRYNGEIHWNADGTFFGSVWVLWKRSGGGKWWTNENRYCRTGLWGDECFAVRQIDKKNVQFEYDDGRVQSFGTLTN